MFVHRNPRRERPERAVSPQPRATPWVSVHKRPRPVRAKVWAKGWLLLLPLQGVGDGDNGTQGVALGWGLVGLSARAGPQTELFTHNLPPLDSSILNALSVMAKVWANGWLLLSPPREVDFVIYSRPRIVLPPAASSATAGCK